jgi:transcriptional regulator with XRE-family HTH domain
MPRPATTDHPLRQVREILGITQIELAKRVACSPVTIKKIENRKLIPGEKLVRRLAAETDIHSHMLLEPEGRLTDRQGKLLSREAHKEKATLTRLTSAKQVNYFTKLFSMMIEALLEASLEPPQPKIHHVLNALRETLDELKTDFGLDTEVEKILPNPDPLCTWATGIAIAAEENKIPLKLDPKAKQQRYQRRRETIKLKKDVSPKKPSRLPLSRGSDNGGKTS